MTCRYSRSKALSCSRRCSRSASTRVTCSMDELSEPELHAPSPLASRELPLTLALPPATEVAGAATGSTASTV